MRRQVSRLRSLVGGLALVAFAAPASALGVAISNDVSSPCGAGRLCRHVGLDLSGWTDVVLPAGASVHEGSASFSLAPVTGYQAVAVALGYTASGSLVTSYPGPFPETETMMGTATISYRLFDGDGSPLAAERSIALTVFCGGYGGCGDGNGGGSARATFGAGALDFLDRPLTFRYRLEALFSEAPIDASYRLGLGGSLDVVYEPVSTAVPEPSTALCLGVGLAALARKGQRRR